jgi:hypothetical protein
MDQPTMSDGTGGSPQPRTDGASRPPTPVEVTVHYNRRGSYCPLSDHHFAESTAADVAEATAHYRGCVLVIGCYTPPYNPPLATEAACGGGFLTLDLLAADRPPACVGIEFGRADTQGAVVRAGFDRAEWQTDPSNPLYAGIYAANFDEAWRIVCLLARLLKPREVTLRYGC